MTDEDLKTIKQIMRTTDFKSVPGTAAHTVFENLPFLIEAVDERNELRSTLATIRKVVC